MERRESGTGTGPGTRELRLALGMRGGVSLAVWMGGACAEIDGLRLAASGAGDAVGFYGPLLEAAGFDGVRVDVLAGASAGGLNGALLASSLMYGVDFSTFRDVWLQVADVGTLLRRRQHGAATSIMRGDYFLEQMRERLHERLAERDRERPPAEYLDLHLSVTATTGHPVAVRDDWAAWYAEAAYRAGFRFRHNRYTSDFTADPVAPIDDATARAVAAKLAIAARSSSSFPGAFEPARLDLARPAELGRRADPHAPGDLVGLFSDASRSVAWVIDGGVLDNIPLERAIRSIAEAPAARPTERWLVYLCPSPEDLDLAGPAAAALWSEDAAPHLVWTLAAFARAAGSRESMLDDMAALRAHNDLAYRYRAARDLLVGRVGGDNPQKTADALLSAAAESARVYERDHAVRTAGGVRALLEDPVEALGEDPFPVAPGWPLHIDGEHVWPRPLREALEASLRDAFAATLTGVATAGDARGAAPLGPFPIARTARFLIGEVRAVEARVADDAARSSLGGHKQELYHLADVAGLLSHLERLFWPTYVTARPPAPADVPAWAGDATAARSAFLAGAHRDGTLAEVGIDEQFTWLRAELTRRLLAADPDRGWGDADDLVVWLWERLADRVRALAADAEPLRSETVDDPDLAATVQLLAAIRSGHVDPLRCIVALEVVAAPLSRISAVPPQPIRFIRLAGSNPTPLAADLPELFPDGRIDVAAKLAGNDLANFAAFYKHAWRANDWMWGRLDAVGTLLHVLLRPDVLGPRLVAAGDGGSGFVAAVEAAVGAPLPDGDRLGEAERHAWEAHLAGLWDKTKDKVEREVVELAGGGHGGLDATVELLTARRQWELVAQELPAVLDAIAVDEEQARAAAGALRRLFRRLRRDRTAPAAGPAASTPAELLEVMRTYHVGRETIFDDLGSDRLTRLATDSAVSSWAALRFALGGRPPGPLRPVGPVLAAARWWMVTFPRSRRLFGLGPRRS